MRLTHFFALAALSAGLLAHSQAPLAPGDTVSPVPPGTYDGSSQQATVSGKSDKINYTDSVYSDASNPFCVGCLDFVITVQNETSMDSYIDATSVDAKGFAGYAVDVAYDATAGNDAPYDASRNGNGNQVSFDFNVYPGEDSDPLIIYTNATAYTTSTLAITAGELSDPAAFGPAGPAVTSVTPEPSSFLLLGTGLLGAVGAVRRRLA